MSSSTLNTEVINERLRELEQRLGASRSPRIIWVSVAQQCLWLLTDKLDCLAQYPVSTAANGVGNQEGSFQTPLGLHQIAEKIGQGVQSLEVFKARVPQGYCVDLAESTDLPQDDYITSRILWLSGLEPGLNQGGSCDSYQRYIYIHGTHEERRIGSPASHGCVRMKNADVMDLFDGVEQADWVYISEE